MSLDDIIKENLQILINHFESGRGIFIQDIIQLVSNLEENPYFITEYEGKHHGYNAAAVIAYIMALIMKKHIDNDSHLH